MRAAQLRDPRHLAEAEKQIEAHRNNPDARPPLEHHSAVVEALHMVGDDIRLLISAMTGAEIPMHKRPAGPAEIIADRRKQIAAAKNAEITGYPEGRIL